MRKSLEYFDYLGHDVLQHGKPGNLITREQYMDFFRGEGAGLNSYEREFIYTIMDNEALMCVTDQLRANITMYEREKFDRPRTTYEEVLLMHLLPIFMQRLREAKELAKLCLQLREHENKLSEKEQGIYAEHVLRRIDFLVEIFALAERVK